MMSFFKSVFQIFNCSPPLVHYLPLFQTVLIVIWSLNANCHFAFWSTPKPVEEFITVWDTTRPGTSGSNQIQIPLAVGASYSATVDWGDGSTSAITSHSDPDALHTYASSGTYTVKITGQFDQIRFNNSTECAKLLEIKNWGTGTWTSFDDAFAGCTLVVSAADAPKLASGTSLNQMFQDAVVNGSLNGWDVRNAIDIDNTFQNASVSADLNNWNLSGVSGVTSMFEDATINGSLLNWNLSGVSTLDAVFQNATFNTPLDSWNVSGVNSMNDMFNGATSFNQPLSSWDTSSVTNMRKMFQGASSYNQDLSGWDVSNVTDSTSFDAGASSWVLPKPSF